MSPSTNNQKSCFVIAPIGSEESNERKNSDQLLRYVLQPALEPKGYHVVRADKISQPGSITTQVLENIIDSDLVVADLTGHNPNVFYELAVRHAAQKPLIHMIAAGQTIPFDVADFRTISFTLDLDGAEKAKKEVIAQVEEIGNGKMGMNPVKLASILQSDTSQSEKKVVLRQMVEGMSELRSDVRDLSMTSGVGYKRMDRLLHRTMDDLHDLRDYVRKIYSSTHTSTEIQPQSDPDESIPFSIAEAIARESPRRREFGGGSALGQETTHKSW